MKITAILFTFLLLFAVTLSADAQRKKTIILVRHAEKDVSPAAGNDPGLSAEGKARAQKLIKAIKRYKPGAVYSTDYNRTRDTVKPVAAWRKKEIEIYDPRRQNELVKQILSSKYKRHLVTGHSNTVPQLANLLIKEEKYKSLQETEFNKIWIIKIRKGKLKSVEVIEY